jgi:hypothetical protein
MLMVEVQVDISAITGVVGATGTADAIILDTASKTIYIRDLKYGRGVEVSAQDNAQLRCYALAALNMFDLVCDFEHIDMGICQPRTGNWSNEVISAAELRQWGQEVRARADVILAGPEGLIANPNPKSCKFCRAKASCPALQSQVMSVVNDDFVGLTKPDSLPSKLKAAHGRIALVDNATLASVMPHLDTIVEWCDAVRAEVARRVFDGQKIPGFKVVDGKKGNRSFVDEADVAKLMLDGGLNESDIYTKKLISPTQAEKLLKKDHPVVWGEVQQLVTQTSGKPAVVPDSDKRPAIEMTNPVDQFDTIEE